MGLKKLDVGWGATSVRGFPALRKVALERRQSQSPWDERGTQLLNVGFCLRYTQPTTCNPSELMTQTTRQNSQLVHTLTILEKTR